MPSFRRKVSAAQSAFVEEIDRLARFDAENQRRFGAMLGRANGLSRKQLHLLTESVFFAAFREYETFVRDIFLLYCLEKVPGSGKRVRSFLKPKNFAHAEQLIQSSMPFLDWTNPTTVIERAELYLRDGFPVKLPLTTNQDSLRDYKRIRNHIAHNSPQSMDDYKKVVRKHFITLPLVIPSPGEFLLSSERRRPGRYKLLTFFDLMRTLATDLT
jgi:hypothetical protein